MIKTDVYILSTEKVKEYPSSFFEKYFPNRLKKANGFKNEKDRLLCLGVSVLLKEILSLDESDIKLTDDGKPYSDKTDKKFNISHSGEYTVLAVCQSNIGVDIQENRQVNNGILQKTLTEEEMMWLKENDGFYSLWCLKEALSKAVGVGLKLGFNKLNVLPMISGKSVGFSGENYFGKAIKTGNYTVSVVTTDDIPEINLILV